MNSTSPAQVVHVVQNLAIGGLERVVVDLATHVDRARYRCSIVCLGAGGALGERAAAAGVPVRTLAKGPGFRVGALARLARILRRERVDLVHCHNTAPLVYGALAGRFAGAAGVVYTAHGMKTSRERKPVVLQRLGLVDHFVTVSEDARRIAVERAGAPAARVATVHNGVDVAAFAGPARSSGRGETRAALGIPAQAFVFGIVARLNAAKDHARLFSAFAELARQDERLRLIVVGDGELRHDLAARVAELGMGDRIVMLGSRSDVADLLATFDCFVLSSHTEGLAVTLLEAMAAGLPIVATRVGGNTEVVVDGETGVVVPPRDTARLRDALAWMAAHAERARAMGARGRERVAERFSVEAMARSYEALYARLLSPGRP